MHLYKDCTIIEITFNFNLQLIVLISEGYEYSRKVIVFVLKYLILNRLVPEKCISKGGWTEFFHQVLLGALI